jgi:hypothetical protein
MWRNILIPSIVGVCVHVDTCKLIGIVTARQTKCCLGNSSHTGSNPSPLFFSGSVRIAAGNKLARYNCFIIILKLKTLNRF